MRPAVLSPLFAGVASLPRIGARSARTLLRLLPAPPEAPEPRIIDLLWHWPYRLIDRSARPSIASAEDGAIATLMVTVGLHAPPANSRRPYKVRIFDESGEASLIFFHAKPAYLTKILPAGEVRFISGRVETFAGERQIAHPDYVLKPQEFSDMPQVEPVYPLTAGITNRLLITAIGAALERIPALSEWQDAGWIAQKGWPSFADALAAVHRPGNVADLEPYSPSRSRLAFDELFANQLALALLRRHRRKMRGRAIIGAGVFAEKARSALPFALTSGQEAAIGEIVADMALEEQMVRLLQGDVGSGKTLVAAMAMLHAIEAGTQAALMAPTEILARQHQATLAPLFAAAGLKVALLTGREQGRTRRGLLEELAEGTIHALIGTHALFQDNVGFHDLGLAVIDEQHRFGVHQRLALQAKSTRGAVDLLVMTATPIPRTLVLTHYGNMDVSRLSERPPGRGRIDTRVLPLERIEEVIERLGQAVAKGARAYWVCPQIDETGDDQPAAAVRRFEALASRFGSDVVLAHGRLPARERDQAMAEFKTGTAKILVATTVIEVGVDVPEATIMVIEQAERFGLAQLHQLRGRVGRGGRDSACVLLYGQPLGAVASQRLEIMRETDDGFRIAEQDLVLRGGGEVLGARQSGLPAFRVADPVAHAPLIEAARDHAELALARLPSLEGAEGAALIQLLYLFERDEAVRLTAAG